LENSSLKDTVALLIDLVKNKCVNPPGNEIKSIKTIQRYLDERDVESQVFESAPNRGNLISRILGVENGPKLMFGPSLVVSDEEEGGRYGTKWMFKNHPELVQTDYAVTEAGGWPLESGKIALTIGEKGTTQSVGDGKLTSFRNVSPLRSEFVDAMERAVQKEVPESTLVPNIMPGKTDATFLRKRGVHVYGYSLFDPETPASERAVHGVDERIRIKTVDLTRKVYSHLAKDFLKR